MSSSDEYIPDTMLGTLPIIHLILRINPEVEIIIISTYLIKTSYRICVGQCKMKM